MAGLENQAAGEPVDVAEWVVDEETYPEGARSKSLIVCPDPAPYPFLRAGHAYLFKRSSHRYPEQYWVEILAYRLGVRMGIPVPPAFVAFNHRGGESAALIEWFLRYPPDPFEQYAPGGDLMQKAIRDYDRKKGTQHNFDTVARWCRGYQPLMTDNWARYWAEAFVFDALIGNTDRHQDNWGVILGFRQSEARFEARLTPVFDHGTSMGHEIVPEHFDRFDDPEYLSHYVARGEHHMKWRRNDTGRTRHSDLLVKYCERFPKARVWMLNCLNAVADALEGTVRGLAAFEVPVPLTEGRAAFMIKLLRYRHGHLGTLLRDGE